MSDVAQPNADPADEPTDQVLEFTLGAETYCVEIRFVAEIVDATDLTPVPNSPPEVEGVMDLRGRTTSIVDPTVVFGIAGENGSGPSAEPDHTGSDPSAEARYASGRRIVVFDQDAVGVAGATGWLVDDVVQVVEIAEGDVEPSPVADDDAVHGIVRRENGLVIWVRPDAVHA